MQWQDKSGNAHDARQPSSQHRPFFVATGLNGKPAIEFREQERTRMLLPDIAEKQITATIFIVFSNPTAPSEVNHDARLLTASDGRRYDYQVGLCCSVPGMQTGGPRQMMWAFRQRWGKDVRIGCFSPNYQTYFTGFVSEILVYRGTLTVGQQDRIRAYLMRKWLGPSR